MAGFWNFARAQWSTLPLIPTKATTTGKTFIVTGANTGLGFEAAKHLVTLGAKHVILGVRSLEKGNAAMEAIAKATGRSNVCEVWQLNLASLASVESFAMKLQTLDRLDALISNASVALAEFTLSEGIETSVTVNVLSTMLLAIRAMPKLQESAKTFGIRPHLSVIASGTAFDCQGMLEDLGSNIFEELSKRPPSMASRYPFTKLLQIYAVRQLSSIYPESETGVVINVASPGLCITELARNANWSMHLQITFMRWLLGRTAEQGSRTLLHAAFAGQESHGAYLSDCQIKELTVPSWITNEDGKKTQQRLWNDLVETLDKKNHKVDVPVKRVDVR
ncbi:hypothetical protein NM208_g12473 [Fusarium decemcellulare]|uniref:Uncharacterized protein n=1 Tax=Fusarium decemcellulare TaxID=57161 RepID=A0ACC1RNH2_9HYPO|nr:hypothetical protein NM208_g12473 [Fusarium decemcellulare]